jgi:hypothetical protein
MVLNPRFFSIQVCVVKMCSALFVFVECCDLVVQGHSAYRIALLDTFLHMSEGRMNTCLM